ncbi:MAG: hypothetical protein IPO92_09015 [Saprospiraceae bacterium]|nr:hypothetical protein [Saprospiraceae bacterium]
MIQNLLLIMATIFLSSCYQQQKPTDRKSELVAFNEAAELETIMKVIDNETNMFFDGNVDGWRSSWSKKDYASQAWNNDDGTANIANGWDAINKQGSEWIEKYYKNGKNVVHPDYKRSKIDTHFYSDSLAYLSWKQYNADKDKKYYRVSGESRIMEKEIDGWKIVNVTALWGIEPKIVADSLPVHLK